MTTSPPRIPVHRRPPEAPRAARRASRARRVLAWALSGLGLLAVAVWVGLRVEPAPLPPPALTARPVATTPLPAGLPAPVERFYRTLHGDEVPLVDSVVVGGRGTMRIQGVTLPSRFRFSHVTGEAYRHHIQTTAFGLPLLTVDEWYVDGAARLRLPFGVSEGPQVDQGANLALWAELVWAPSVWVTDPAARWEAVDATTARLLVPFGEEVEVFTVTFDPDDGMLRRMESLRFRGEQDEQKTPWINEVLEWGELDGRPAPLVTTVAWGDEGSPWAVLRTEDVLVNADLTAYVRAEGP